MTLSKNPSEQNIDWKGLIKVNWSGKREAGGIICMGWMVRQRPEELDQSMVPGAKQLEDQTNNIAMQLCSLCFKPVPTDVSQYSHLSERLSRITAWLLVDGRKASVIFGSSCFPK